MCMKFLISFLLSLCLCVSIAYAAVKEIPISDQKMALFLPAETLPMALIQLTFPKIGGVSDPMGKAGRAYMAAALLKEGAGNYSGTEFRTALEEKAIELSVSAGQEKLTITVQALTKHVQEALRLVHLMLTEPRFEHTALEKIRRQTLAELKQRSQNPGWVASVEFDKLAYGNHPLANPTIGTRQSLKDLTRGDIHAWHKQLSSSEMILSVAGKVDESELKKAFATLIEALPSQRTQKETAKAPEIPSREKSYIIRQKIPQTVAMFGLPAPKREDPDFYATYVMNHILGGGGLTSRLSRAIRQKRGLAYSAGSYLSMGCQSQLLLGSFATRNESALEALDVAQTVLQQFAAKGSTKHETQNAIDYLTGSFPLNLDNLHSQVSYLTSMQYYGLGKDYLEKRNDYFKAVTHEDVNRVAAKLLAKPPLVVLVGDPKGD